MDHDPTKRRSVNIVRGMALASTALNLMALTHDPRRNDGGRVIEPSRFHDSEENEENKRDVYRPR